MRVQPVINISTMRMLDFQILRRYFITNLLIRKYIKLLLFSGESALPHKHLVVSSPIGFSVGIFLLEFDSK